MKVKVIPLYVTRKTLDLENHPGNATVYYCQSFIPERLKYRDHKAEQVFEILNFPCDEHWMLTFYGARQERFYTETEIRALDNRLVGRSPLTRIAHACPGDTVNLNVHFEADRLIELAYGADVSP